MILAQPVHTSHHVRSDIYFCKQAVKRLGGGNMTYQGLLNQTQVVTHTGAPFLLSPRCSRGKRGFKAMYGDQQRGMLVAGPTRQAHLSRRWELVRWRRRCSICLG